MQPNFLFERLFLLQKKQCGRKYLDLNNPFKLTDSEISKTMINKRFIDHVTSCIAFTTAHEGKQQTNLYFRRLEKRGNTLGDLFCRLEKHNAKVLLESLRSFYKFEISLKTGIRELTDE